MSPGTRSGPIQSEAEAVTHDELATAIRMLSVDAVDAAQSGHPGLPLGMADVATVLFTRHLRFDPTDPEWPDRDRFVLSAGHGSMLLYSTLWLCGYDGVGLAHLRRFRQLGSPAAGHPEYGHMPGVETTTGPLGQGLATAVGMAMAERRLRAEFGPELVDHRTYVVAGDGCLMEGISQEAISLAGHHQLERLVVLFDDNGISIDGPTSLTTSEDQLARFSACGWATAAVDGHDPEAVSAALEQAAASERPTLIACRTVIGRGAPAAQGTAAAHGAPLGPDDLDTLRRASGWGDRPFAVPDAVVDAWRAVGRRGVAAHQRWKERLQQVDGQHRQRFLKRMIGGDARRAVEDACELARTDSLATPTPLATRKASSHVLQRLVKTVPTLFGGAADLSDSTGVLTPDHRVFTPERPDGNYIHFGVREHAMAAALNGIALHGGLQAFGSTFLAFADYCRPAIRLSALMGLPVVYVMTHDSIALGEDGPTHQPVEQIESLRAMPNLLVFRPADAVETAHAWELALTQASRPSVLCLTRQAVPPLPRLGAQCDVGRGGYLVGDPGRRDVTLLATGSEVAVAVGAAETLAAEGIDAAVVSLPCVELFAEQDAHYRGEVLGDGPRVAVEAGVAGSWSRWLGEGGRFVGMRGFGASAPGPVLSRHFGFTPAAVAAAARELV